MPIEAWIARWGYWATALGGMVESETVVLLAGLSVHRGLLELPGVIAAAGFGTFGANQLLFHLGRNRGHTLLARFPRLQLRAQGVLEFANRHRRTLVFLYHFTVGIRAMTPFVLGMGPMRALRFAAVDFVVTFTWIATLATLGFWLGDALTHWLPSIQRAEVWVTLGVVGLGVVAWLARRAWTRRRRLAE